MAYKKPGVLTIDIPIDLNGEWSVGVKQGYDPLYTSNPECWGHVIDFVPRGSAEIKFIASGCVVTVEGPLPVITKLSTELSEACELIGLKRSIP